MAREQPEMRTLFARRPVLNADALIEWAKGQGLSKPLASSDLHVTIAYSKDKFDWFAAPDDVDRIRIPSLADHEAQRSVEEFGDKGAIVLRFEAADLARRWQQFRDAGASWDHKAYRPHVTITYGPGDVDIATIEPYTGPIELGPEEFSEIDQDWKPKMAGDALAFDRASTRTYDQDGHLHVARTPISKANVCPYYGREIPDWEGLGLNPERLYQLLRDPEELEKAAATFAGKPLLNVHRPVTADDHEHEAVAGSISNPVWEAPYLKADLSIWDGPAIKAIEAETQKELSSAYRYRADMTPGTYEGVRYDGVMRDLSANHVALVKEGRAGPDVVVGDEMPIPKIKEFISMAKKPSITRGGAAALTALSLYLKPKLAQDAKVDLSSVLAKVTSSNFAGRKPAIIAGVKKQAEGKLAQDASLDDIGEVVEALAQILPEEAAEVIEDGDDADDGPASDDDDADLRALLKAKGLSDDEIARICAGNAAAMDGDADDDKDKVTKTAMDAAIAAAVKSATKSATAAAIKTQQDIRDAERAVRPYVGDLAMAHDSADAVYRTALTSLGVEIEGVHPSAFPAILKLQPKPGDTPSARKPIAQDAAASKEFETRFPHANRLKV
ncbi:DUF2213 domain-containing protein [Bosea sp. TAF32]|uniref:DUF2213 domain-containing protein n=1 Tax=Bosea sp. TAF32 TaxID=3237482 RepID=UPI003F8E2AC8